MSEIIKIDPLVKLNPIKPIMTSRQKYSQARQRQYDEHEEQQQSTEENLEKDSEKESESELVDKLEQQSIENQIAPSKKDDEDGALVHIDEIV